MMPGPSSYTPGAPSMPSPAMPPIPGGMPRHGFVGGFHSDEARSGYNPSYYGQPQPPRIPPRMCFCICELRVSHPPARIGPTSAHSPPPTHPQRTSSYAPQGGPPLPSRPSGHENSGQPPYGPGIGRGGGLVGGVLDRIGSDRRKALEQRVDAVTQGRCTLLQISRTDVDGVS